MYYDPEKNDHGLRHNPFKSCVTPRPIGWISTISPEGVHNLAPYSQFQNLTFDPPYVMFSANQTTEGKRKDSVINAEQTGEFVYNMATYDLREAVNKSAAEVPPDVDEFELAGVNKAPSIKIKPCRVAESPGRRTRRTPTTIQTSSAPRVRNVDRCSQTRWERRGGLRAPTPPPKARPARADDRAARPSTAGRRPRNANRERGTPGRRQTDARRRTASQGRTT